MGGGVELGSLAWARRQIEEMVRDAGLGPPDAGTLLRASGLAPADFDRHVRDLLRTRTVARLDDLLFHAEVLAGLRQEVLELGRGTPPGVETWLDVATFKGRYALSRKYAIPLLEWLDRERVTRRVGDRRLLLV